MSAITLKNVPSELRAELKRRARLHHRSLNGEVLCCLQSIVAQAAEPVERLIAEAAEVREQVGGYLTDESLRGLKNTGRPRFV